MEFLKHKGKLLFFLSCISLLSFSCNRASMQTSSEKYIRLGGELLKTQVNQTLIAVPDRDSTYHLKSSHQTLDIKLEIKEGIITLLIIPDIDKGIEEALKLWEQLLDKIYKEKEESGNISNFLNKDNFD